MFIKEPALPPSKVVYWPLLKVIIQPLGELGLLTQASRVVFFTPAKREPSNRVYCVRVCVFVGIAGACTRAGKKVTTGGALYAMREWVKY